MHFSREILTKLHRNNIQNDLLKVFFLAWNRSTFRICDFHLHIFWILVLDECSYCLEMLFKHHLIFAAHEFHLGRISILQIRQFRVLIILLQHKLFALFLQCLLFAQLRIWKAIMEHLVEIKMVPVQELYGISVGMETHLLCFIVLNYVTLADDGSWVNWNVEWSANVFLLEWTPVKSGDTALHDGEFLNA